METTLITGNEGVSGPGSDFILGTNDSIRDGTPLENVKAYFEGDRKFGEYPIG
jgi:hypothetical protein